jgi:hypothetical protein
LLNLLEEEATEVEIAAGTEAETDSILPHSSIDSTRTAMAS